MNETRIVKSDDAGLSAVRDILLAGGVAVIPTDTVYGLAAHPSFPDAVERLYAIKGREKRKPIAMLVSSAEAAANVAGHLPDRVYELERLYWPGALTIVASGEGMRMPNHTWTLRLLESCGGALRVTSANLSGQRAATDALSALREIGLSADIVVDDGISPGGTASTVVKIADDGALTVLRDGPLKF